MTSKATNSKSAKKNPFYERHKEALSAVIGALLGGVLTFALYAYQNRLAVIEFIVAKTPAVIQRPELGGKDFKVTIGGQQVENISTVTVYVFNRSNQDFEDVPIVITASGNPRPNLISSHVGLPSEAYTEIQQPGKLGSDEQKVGYQLKVANRSTQSVFRADLVFDGAVPPTISVDVLKKGIETRELDPSVLNKADGSWSPITSGIAWGLGFAAAFFTFGRLAVYLLDRKMNAQSVAVAEQTRQVKDLGEQIAEAEEDTARTHAMSLATAELLKQLESDTNELMAKRKLMLDSHNPAGTNDEPGPAGEQGAPKAPDAV